MSGVARNDVLDAAIGTMRSGTGEADGVMLLDDGGVIVVVARGDLAAQLFEVVDDHTRRAVQAFRAGPRKR